MADETNKSVVISGLLKPGASKTLKGDKLGSLRLRNSGGTLKLFDPDPCLVDHVMWSKNEATKFEGRALIFK